MIKRKLETVSVGSLFTVLEGIADAAIASDARGRILFINRLAEALTGWEREQAAGKELSEVLDIPEQAISSSLSGSTRVTTAGDITLKAKDGSPMRVEWDSTEIRDHKGRVTGTVFLLRRIPGGDEAGEEPADEARQGLVHELGEGGVERLGGVSQRIRAEQALRDSEAKHQRLFETMAQGVVYQDASGRIIDANPAAERILGLSLDQMQGRTSLDPRWRAIHEDGSDFLGDTHPAMVSLRTGEPQKDVIMGVYHPQDEAYRWILINSTPLFQAGEEKPYQVYTTFNDITERVQSEEALRQSEARWRSMSEGSPDHILVLDTDMRIQYANHASPGLRVEELIGTPLYTYVEEERQPEVEAILEGVLKTGTPASYETVYTIPGGGILHYESRVVPWRLPDSGEIIGLLLSARDISEIKRMEEAYRESEARFRRLTINIPDIIYRYRFQPDPGFEYISPAIEYVTGYTPEELYADPELIYTIIHPNHHQAWPRQIDNRTVSLTRYMIWTHKDGTPVWIENRPVITYDRKGVPVAFEGVARDVTKRKQAEEALHKQATTDPLTGLFNRRYFFDLAEGEFRRAKRYQSDLSIILIDLDDFKRINDTLGHMVGDQALQVIAKTSQEALRGTDVLARYGGEEFAILLPETNSANAWHAAERLRGRIEQTFIETESGLVRLTASLGIANLLAGDIESEQFTLDKLITRADQALYQAKRAGRNRVCVWTEA